MEWLIGIMSLIVLVMLGVAIVRRAKSLPAITDERPLSQRNPELARLFPKRRGA